MTKKIIYIILVLCISGCSVIPQLIQAAPTVEVPAPTEQLVIEEESNKPEATASIPVCPEVVCPTCPAVPSTPIVITATPEITSTDNTMPSTPQSVTPTGTAQALQPSTSTPTTTPAQYTLQQGTPRSQANIFHVEAGCNWFGVAGQVFDRQGRPQSSLVVMVRGTYNGRQVLAAGVTGYSAANIYGPGGFEIVLGNRALDSINALSIQLFNIQGQPLSDPVQFSTFSSCSQNLIIINFNQRP